MPKTIRLLLIFIGLSFLAGMIYLLPPVNDRLSWRVDFAMAKVRSMINPVKAMPTALPDKNPEVVQQLATATPIPTFTPAPTATAQLSPTPIPTATPIPEKVQLSSPEYEKQDINNCGPAALTMYLRYYGWQGTQEDVTLVVKPYREDRNVNVEELAYYVRNHAGWLTVQYRVGGNLDLIKELIAAGIPVMVEETFIFDEPYWTNDDLWAAHYQLLTGYDDATQEFIGQDSFHGPDLQIPYAKMDEYWQAFNRVYILIYPPQQEAQVKDILGENWDPDVNRQLALEIAQRRNRVAALECFCLVQPGNKPDLF